MKPISASSAVICCLVGASLCGAQMQHSAETTVIAQGPNVRHFTPSEQPLLVIQDADVKVELAPHPFPYVLSIQPLKGNGTTQKISLPYELAQVDQLSLWHSLIILRGLANNALGIVVLLDKSTGTMTDKIVGYWPSISLARGLIIFTKPYPIHFADGTEDHYMVYDLSRTAAANRPPGDGNISGLPIGIPLYPPNAGNRNFDNIGLHGPLHVQDSAGFFWNESNNEAVTLDEFGGHYTLVLLDVRNPDVVVSTLAIDPQAVCAGRTISGCNGSLLYLKSASFAVGNGGGELITASFGYPQEEHGVDGTFSTKAFQVVRKQPLEHPQWVGVGQ